MRDGITVPSTRSSETYSVVHDRVQETVEPCELKQAERKNVTCLVISALQSPRRK